MNKLTLKQAKKEAREIANSGTIDFEEGETKKDWIECYIGCLREDGLIVD